MATAWTSSAPAAARAFRASSSATTSRADARHTARCSTRRPARSARRRHACLLEVPFSRLVFLVLAGFDQTELHGFVAVLVGGLHLRHDAGTRLEHSCR